MMNWLYGRSRLRASDHPVAVEVNLAGLVFLVAVGIGVSGGIEPEPSPAFAIVG